MDTDKLKAFLAVAKAKSMKRAAENLNYTQSGLLYMMNSLEDELGIQLLCRDYRGVFLSEEGKALYPLIEKIVDGVASLESEVESITNVSRSNRIVIAAYPVIARQWLPMIIKQFRDLHPDINIQVYATIDQMPHLLDEGAVDFAIGGPASAGKHHITVLREEEVYVAIPSTEPFSPNKAVILDNLVKYPVLIPNHIHPDSVSHADLKNWAEQNGNSVNLDMATTDGCTILPMVGAGLGITFLSRLYCAECPASVRMLPLTPPIFRQIVLAQNSKKKLSPAARDLISFIKDWAT